MVDIVKMEKMVSKEHNGDYLSEDLINEKFNLGLDTINIAPEFGQLETRVILNKMKEVAPELIEEFYQICYESKRWVKWVSKDFKSEENKEEIINISGHYIFSSSDFIKLKERLNIDDNEIKLVIKDKLKKLV
jgi:DNA modification methylase